TGVPATSTGDFDNYPVGNEGNINRFEGISIIIDNPNELGIGEILIKSVLMMKGYFRDQELTISAFNKQGYYKTGDLGYIDKKNNLHVTGRIKEAIMLHTGKKVAPSDVDDLYSKLCPDTPIASCGVPYRDGMHDEIHLFVEKSELSEEEQLSLKNRIMEFSAETSTLYQIAAIHFINKLPITSVGKVKRFQLKEIALAELAGGN
ncbi:MAG: acyl--CoA ligase, partial [Treponema sp.]|nr:acyl--CoA ligase [Treponema sp.]